MSEPLSDRLRAGLMVESAPVPLLGVAVEVQIRAFAARVVMRQRYRNEEAHPIEAVYVFPLDEGAAVCGFEAEIGGVRVVGRVEEREAAFERYDDALAAGHGAYLLDQERPDVFTASLGNIPPGAEVTVTLVTVSELPLAGDEVRFVLPTAVSPRYASAGDWRGVGRSPADAVNPPLALRVPYGMDVTVDVDMGVEVHAVESPSHPIAVEIDGARATVRLGERTAVLDRDFVLSIRTAETPLPQAFVESGRRDHGAAMVTFRPQFEAGSAASEIVFLIDRSGSMEGTSIAEARNALQLCLRSLTGDQVFNVVGFGSRHTMLFPVSRAYDETSLSLANAHVAGLRADMGGTEILAALQAIFATPPQAGRPRQLFVLTDGQVSNTGAVLQLVRRHSDTTRVFTFGIGAGASQHLVRGMARAGEGAAEFIAPGERIERKVMRQLDRALAPAVTGLTLDWGGLAVTQAPYRLPPVFAGGRVVVYGLFDGAPKPARVTLRGRGTRGELEWAVELDPAAARDERVIATLAARAMIRDLEEGMSILHNQRGSLQAREREERVKAEIVRLGVHYTLASRETSFVAVEERATPLHGEMQLRRIPIALTRGWGGIEDALLGGVPGRPSAPPSTAAPVAPGGPRWPRPPMTARAKLNVLDNLALEEEPSVLHDVQEPAMVRDMPRASAQRPLDRLVALQAADGSWNLTEDLARIFGTTLRKLESALHGVHGEVSLARRAWATALALSWLERNAPDERDEWMLLARKASAWLARNPVWPASGDWPSLAAQFDL